MLLRVAYVPLLCVQVHLCSVSARKRPFTSMFHFISLIYITILITEVIARRRVIYYSTYSTIQEYPAT